MPRRTNSSNSGCSTRSSSCNNSTNTATPAADQPTSTTPSPRALHVRPLGIDTVALTVQDPPREQDNGAPFFIPLDANNDNKDQPYQNTPRSRPPSFSPYPGGGDPTAATPTAIDHVKTAASGGDPQPFSDFFNVLVPGTLTSPKFRPIQATVAPLSSSEGAHAQAEPLYHTAAVPPLAPTLSHAHNTNTTTHHLRQNGQAFQPYPFSVDPRAQDRNCYGHTISSSAGHTGPSLGGAAAGTNIRSPGRSKRHTNGDGNRIRTSQHSARTQISGSTTAVRSRNSERLLSSSSSSSSANSISSSHLSRQQKDNGPSRKATSKKRPAARGPPAVPEPLATAPVSRKRFSLFRRPFATQAPVDEKAAGKSRLAEPRLSVSWESGVWQDDGRPTRPKRKTGVPGLNGEEPETNPFNFIDIMLDMSYRPSWREVWTKMGKAVTLLTFSYFCLMALYFGASVRQILMTVEIEAAPKNCTG